MNKKQVRKKTSVSLDPEVIELLDDFAKVFDTTRSSAMNDLILMAKPQIVKVLREYEKFVSEVHKTMPVPQDQLDMFTGRIFRKIFEELDRG